MAVGSITHATISGVEITTSFQTIYTVPTGYTAIFASLWAVNTSNAQRKLIVHKGTAISSPGSPGLVVDYTNHASKLAAGDHERFVFENITAGIALRARADATGVVISGAVTLKQIS